MRTSSARADHQTTYEGSFGVFLAHAVDWMEGQCGLPAECVSCWTRSDGVVVSPYTSRKLAAIPSIITECSSDLAVTGALKSSRTRSLRFGVGPIILRNFH